MTRDVLPDSRLSSDVGSVLGEFKSPVDGSIKRIEWVPTYCANCGKLGDLVPKDVTFAFYLCQPCADKNGPIAGIMMVPDEVFMERVAAEMLESHGRYLTDVEIAVLDAEGRLGSGLEKLARESPYKV